jgi:3-oxoacyl-[acyl-carrier-protein] synthase-3
MDETVQAGKLKSGDMIAMAGFGSGLTWGSAMLEWI